MTATDIDREREMLFAERNRLAGIGYHNKGLTGELAGRYAAVTARLLEILAVPPAGWALPKAAAELMDTAKTCGWQTACQWSADNGGSPFVTVEVGHADGGSGWHYKVTWHSRGTGTLRLFSTLAKTPRIPAWHDGPSLKAMKAVIHDNPKCIELAA